MPADSLIHLPAPIPAETAAAMTMRGLTAAYLLRRIAPGLGAGDTVLLHAAAGGVGLIVCQWARLLGIRVIGVVSTAEKAEIARRHGAAETIVGTADLAARVRAVRRRRRRPGPARPAAQPQARATGLPDARLSREEPAMSTLPETGTPDPAPTAPRVPAASSRFFPGLVFGLTFALLISDYMSRQVLAAVFPYLKVEWGLSDTALGSLNSVVSLAVGLFAVPLSILGDRFGRVRAITAMAVLWSVATLASAWASTYGELLAARIVVGVGEAAYGSIGLAVVFLVFKPPLRSTLSGAFLGGGAFGSVLGVAIGGVVAARFGWRPAFVTMGVIGLVLALVYAVTITERRVRRHEISDAAQPAPESAERMTRASFRTLFSTPAVVMAYLGAGLQLFMTGTLLAWLPSFFNRSYEMAPDRAGKVAAIYLLVLGAGMIGTGMISDRARRRDPRRTWTTSIGYCVVALVCLGGAFSLQPGPAQLALLAVGAFFCSGPAGPAGAMVAALTRPAIRATAFATLSLAINVLGLALGPVVTGRIADSIGLAGALQVVPWVGLLAIGALFVGWRTHDRSVAQLRAETAEETP